MLYLILRLTTNIVIVSGLLLAAFGFGGTIGKTIEDFTAPVPRGESASISQPRPRVSALRPAQAKSSQAAAKVLAAQEPLPTPAENGFVPYRIPVPVTGDPAEAALPAATDGSPPTGPSEIKEPPGIPDRIVIPQIGLDAPVVLSPIEWVELDGTTYQQWEAPNFFAAGWQEGSAMPGQTGNFILTGHHNVNGQVFAHLVDLKEGDVIAVFSGERLFGYYVHQVILLEEREVSLIQRQENAMWIRPTADERLTLVTCWPPDSNTHRLIIVAQPAQ